MTTESPAPDWDRPASAPATSSGAGIYRMSLTTVTSILIMSRQRHVVHTGTVEALEDAYRKALTHNLALGWWGIPFGLIWTPIALVKNRKNVTTIRGLAAGRSTSPTPVNSINTPSES